MPQLPRRRLSRLPLILLCSLLCASCAFGSTPPSPIVITKEVQLPPPPVPAELQTCPDAPEVPDTVMTNDDIAQFMIDDYTAGEKCRSVVHRRAGLDK